MSFNARRIIALVEKLLRGGYIAACPRPTLTAHGLYRLTDRGKAAIYEADRPGPLRKAPRGGRSAGS